jgi:hypothetical protein
MAEQLGMAEQPGMAGQLGRAERQRLADSMVEQLRWSCSDRNRRMGCQEEFMLATSVSLGKNRHREFEEKVTY